MKRCAQCHGKLGLGVRFRNVGNGRWRVHVRFCSAHCEALHELERYDPKRALRPSHLAALRKVETNVPTAARWPYDI
jgi:hypothetical protein